MLIQQLCGLPLRQCDSLSEDAHDAGNADPRSMGKRQRLKTTKRKPLRKRKQVNNKAYNGQLPRKTFEPKHKSEIELKKARLSAAAKAR
jgi:hypothetical protein